MAVQDTQDPFDSVRALLNGEQPAVSEEREKLPKEFFNYLVGEPFLDYSQNDEFLEVPENRVKASRDMVLDIEAGRYNSSNVFERLVNVQAEISEVFEDAFSFIGDSLRGEEDDLYLVKSPEEAYHLMIHNPSGEGVSKVAAPGVMGGSLTGFSLSMAGEPETAILLYSLIVPSLAVAGASSKYRMELYDNLRETNDRIEEKAGGSQIRLVEDDSLIEDYRNEREPYCRV